MAPRCRPSAGVGNHPMARKAEPEGYGCPSLVQPMVRGAVQAPAADGEEGRRILRFAFWTERIKAEREWICWSTLIEFLHFPYGVSATTTLPPHIFSLHTLHRLQAILAAAYASVHHRRRRNPGHSGYTAMSLTLHLIAPAQPLPAGLRLLRLR
ncbi:hypothetical protein STAS_11247 [Striga asiatica]|uniref:Uncharacterized protein n=1 Tax=Striga asiatica TaxID=4170 RepID=A0A5A7PQQ5_STRAF|nr:hypothetical protein STAS_11247 [Striga asiatica]